MMIPTSDVADLERRFGGLRRLYGPTGYARVRGARIAVVGVGGVGSWTAEALARSGVAGLTLIDLDHVAESNINRQVHALEPTLGQAKVLALQERIALIHPGCVVHAVEEFVDEDNVAALLGAGPLDGVIDCCDQVRAKAAVAAWARAQGVPVVSVGAAGGKVSPHLLEVGDLAEVTHDPLLASLRQRLRQRHGGARKGPMGLRCVFSREAVRPPQDAVCEVGAGAGPDAKGADAVPAASSDGSLNCHGFGSTVTVTATFGMVAAAELVNRLIAGKP
jgi:tRNA A37 threonylcarbamoyladenosine dehydratase